MPAYPTASSNAPATLVDLLAASVRRFGGRPCLGQKHGDLWTWTSYGELHTLVRQCRGGLAAIGVEPGDRVALISNNRLEWVVVAYAAFGLGAAVVPMTPAQATSEWRFVVSDSQARVLLCATPDICNACGDLPGELPSLGDVLCFERAERATRSYEEFLELGRSQPVSPTSPAPADSAMVIYTSGTTGKPKGVDLSHANLCSNVAAVAATFPLSWEDRSLSILPWAHAFGQTCELHTLLHLGGSLALAESSDKVIQNLAEVQPSVLISVPTIFNRIVDLVSRQMVARPRVIQKLFVKGMALSAKGRRQPLRLTERAALATADRMVLSRLRHQLGGKLRYAISGGAALPARASELFETLGIPIYEGYGLTEASPVVCANSPRSRRFGTVGKPLPGVRVTVDRRSAAGKGQGELIVYGPGVMKGYLDRSEETARA
ncbi:MAG: AMP-binding protein, partial [Deltaproteobacteria bacterium]|nr:AMP-binding protein [Deltaproteobacteria bacterium]